MKRVKQFMEAYKKYAKEERAKIKALEKTNMYSVQYIAEQAKKIEDGIQAKHQEYLKSINEVIDGKLSAVEKYDASSTEYQAEVTNIFTKVQMLNRALTPELVKEILAPAVEKQDNSIIEAVRNYLCGISDIPGGEPRKRELLASVPFVINQADILDHAKEEINRVFLDSNFLDENMKNSITMSFLEQSRVFEL